MSALERHHPFYSSLSISNPIVRHGRVVFRGESVCQASTFNNTESIVLIAQGLNVFSEVVFLTVVEYSFQTRQVFITCRSHRALEFLLSNKTLQFHAINAEFLCNSRVVAALSNGFTGPSQYIKNGTNPVCLLCILSEHRVCKG